MTVDAGTLAKLISDRFSCDIGEITDNEAIFSGGLLDSFNLIDLITELESTYSIRIKATDVNLENFDSVNRMVKLVAGKLSD